LLFIGNGAALSGDETMLEVRISNVLHSTYGFAGVNTCQYLNANVLLKIRSNCQYVEGKWLWQAAWNNNNAGPVEVDNDWSGRIILDFMGDISKKKHRKITGCPVVYC